MDPQLEFASRHSSGIWNLVVAPRFRTCGSLTWRRVKVVLVFGMKACRVEVRLHTFLTSPLTAVEWWTSRLGRFSPWRKSPWRGLKQEAKVGPQAFLEDLEKVKISWSYRESNRDCTVVQPSASLVQFNVIRVWKFVFPRHAPHSWYTPHWLKASALIKTSVMYVPPLLPSHSTT